LLIFLLPSLVKLEHNHRYFINISKAERHSQLLRDNCGICNFEFSIFISDGQDTGFQNDNPSDRYSINYDSQDYSYICQFSFSLRAPPFKQI
jgi:hypothetical protein